VDFIFGCGCACVFIKHIKKIVNNFL